MSALDRVVAALDERGCNPRGAGDNWTALCPAHEDRNPSLSISYRNEKVLLNCHAGCERATIVAELGMEWTDLFDGGERPAPAARTVLRRYPYVDADGKLLFEVERLAPKGFRQRRPDGAGGWAWNLSGTTRVIYRLPAVLAAVREGKPIWVVEGEKDVESLEKLGQVATTNPGGAGKWRPEYSEALRGARVGIVADSDDAGRRHALSVANALDGIAKTVTLLELLPCGCKDVTQHVERGHSLRDLRPFERAAAQAALEDSNGRRRAPVVSARDFCARPAPDGSLQLLGPALWRTMRLSIGASTGEGKTTMGCQMVRAVVRREPFLDERWVGPGGRALVADVEQGEETVKQRLREIGLDDDPNVDVLWEPDGLALDRSDEDRKYVDDALRAGRYDVALFDPLYQLHCGEENSERTAADLMRVLDGWAREYGLGIIIPMHRRKPHAQAGLNNFTIHEIGGHGAWVRNSEIVLGLQFVHPGRSFLRVFKDRPGFLPGVGTRLSLSLDREHRFAIVEESESGWQVTKRAIEATPGRTTADLAEEFDVKPETIRNHCRKIKAHADDTSLPLAEQRWQLEPWPSNERTLWEEDAPV